MKPRWFIFAAVVVGCSWLLISKLAREHAYFVSRSPDGKLEATLTWRRSFPYPVLDSVDGYLTIRDSNGTMLIRRLLLSGQDDPMDIKVEFTNLQIP